MISRRSALDVVVLAVAIILVGALLFGLWHVVVGGFVNGNPRAARFGVALSMAASGLLVVAAVVGRRLRRA